MQETLDSDMNLYVVAKDSAWRYLEHKRIGPSCHQLSRRLSTAGLANVNGLMSDEISVFQGHHPMLDRFLDFHRPAALQAGLFGSLELSPDPHCGENPMSPVLLHAGKLYPHRRDRREARFFLPRS